MDLSIPKDEIEFFKHIWKIIGNREIKQDELIYNLSFKMNFPDSPLKMANKVRNALKKGTLVKKESKICLNHIFLDELKKNNALTLQKIPSIFPRSINSRRIEDNTDPWKLEELLLRDVGNKPKSRFVGLLKKVFSKDEISRGNRVESAKVEIKEIDDKSLIFEAEIKGSSNNQYKLKIDAGNMIIYHDCPDFIKNHLRSKTFCKHFYRSFTNLRKVSEEFGVIILDSLKDGRDNWVFQSP